MKNKVWFITGASSGFGKALAEAVLARGDKAAVAARRADALSEIVSRYPDHALAVPLDVTLEPARREAVEKALGHFGKLDVLANIAGRGSLGAAEEFSAQQLREQMEINFFSAVEMTRAVLPTMRSQRGGHILQLTSIGGIAAFQGFAPYCASKFALEGWSEALQGEVAKLGIKVTIIEPGAFRTEFAGEKNMRAASEIDDYRLVIEPIQEYLYGSDGKQPGDPRKAAQAILRVVDSEQPPLRLLLGEDALGLIEKKLKTIHGEMKQWNALSKNTAFDGVYARPVGG